MPQFLYKAVREDGSSSTGESTAANAIELRRDLEARGYLVLDIKLKREGLQRSGISSKDFLLFNQEFMTLIKAGLPILQTLEIVRKRSVNITFKTIIDSLIREIKGGTALSDAMAMHPDFFTSLYTATVRAGEKSGALAEVLSRHTAYLKRTLALRRKLVTALIYPSLVVVFVLAVLILFIFVIVPGFMQTQNDQAQSLPAITAFVFSLSQGLLQYAPYWSTFLVALLVGLYYWVKSAAGKTVLDKLKLKLPVLGVLITQYLMAQMTRTLATVLRGGVPLVQALDTTADAINNSIITARLRKARTMVTEGVSLADSFDRAQVAPDITISMVEVGESSGDLPQMLENVADFYEDSADSKIPILTTLIEVAIISFLGLLVAFIVISLYLPIFEMGARMG
ncbi:MAG: hypothetical protein A2X56_01135 [Nitrospirae bacterium GWC2_57_13]|jgi:type IV pilus assembly protein PilC|nr:MAG: hypothetical protein A2072_06390 [Nitrospirae bacterium GWC1_57_7]OGW26546.1 MAG: hypothetical protein A2X56_01135 [Nitrospirae bacterium GWC2_57_13]OGW42665.1 MAG: hypothetical protein A2X57_11895 [Nitrospirae bacterium GWD2_57_8]HAR45519.1 hypothetical protein [Nitrospiraceae bacterium]HAS54579.1 hypothetical protein [Nitrospiraceae bacterium]